VVREVFKTKVKNGLMGTFEFDKKGNICPVKVISFYQLRGTTGIYNFVVANRVNTGC
jgi:hypothetical protein